VTVPDTLWIKSSSLNVKPLSPGELRTRLLKIGAGLLLCTFFDALLQGYVALSDGQPVTRKNGICNSSRLTIAGIIWRKVLHILTPRHPWLKLPRLHHHVFDGVTPSVALLPVQDHMGNCGLTHIRFTRSLKGHCSN